VLNRMQGLLTGYDVHLTLHEDVETQLEHVRQSDGTLLPMGLWARLRQEWQQVQLRTEQLGCRLQLCGDPEPGELAHCLARCTLYPGSIVNFIVC